MLKTIVRFILFASVFIVSPAIYADEKQEKPALSFPEKADYQTLRIMGTAKADQIIDGLTIHLNDDRIIQFSGIDLPDLTPYEAGDIAVAAQEALGTLLLGNNITLYQTKKDDKGRTNRMGYHLAHVEISKPAAKEDDTAAQSLWAQGYLILNGLARVHPTERTPEMAAQMYALENIAREKKSGMWDAEKYPAYQVLTPETANSALNSFAVIEGTIKSVAMVKNTIYMNFGNNWRNDFTVAIETPIRRQLSKDRPDLNLLSMGGKSVRVRGWVEDYNGPFIRLEHPALIEFLPETRQDTNLEPAENN